MAVPKWAPEEAWESFEPTGESTVETKDMSPEDVVRSDGESTLVIAIRMGLRGGKGGSLANGDLFLAEAIPARFLTFMRDKDPSGMMRRHIAQYLRKVADEWESGEVLKHAPDDASRKSNP